MELHPGLSSRVELLVTDADTAQAVGSGDVSPALLGHTLTQHWSLATALAFLAWYVFAPQCASTLGVVKRETNSWLWPGVMAAYMLAMAYAAALITYQVASALGAG